MQYQEKAWTRLISVSYSCFTKILFYLLLNLRSKIVFFQDFQDNIRKLQSTQEKAFCPNLSFEAFSRSFVGNNCKKIFMFSTQLLCCRYDLLDNSYNKVPIIMYYKSILYPRCHWCSFESQNDDFQIMIASKHFEMAKIMIRFLNKRVGINIT